MMKEFIQLFSKVIGIFFLINGFLALAALVFMLVMGMREPLFLIILLAAAVESLAVGLVVMKYFPGFVLKRIAHFEDNSPAVPKPEP